MAILAARECHLLPATLLLLAFTNCSGNAARQILVLLVPLVLFYPLLRAVVLLSRQHRSISVELMSRQLKIGSFFAKSVPTSLTRHDTPPPSVVYSVQNPTKRSKTPERLACVRTTDGEGTRYMTSCLLRSASSNRRCV